MFGLCRASQEGATEDAKAEMVCEIIRFLGRVEKSPLMLAYARVIFDLAETLESVAALKTRDWRTSAIDSADLAVAPALVERGPELKSWLRHHPQFVFSLVAGLSMGRGEDYAWALAYG